MARIWWVGHIYTSIERARGGDSSSNSPTVANTVLTLLFDSQAYPLQRQQVALLIYKLSALASGALPREIDYLGAGEGWLADASRLADSLYLALHDSSGVTIELQSAEAFALYQTLRVTYTGPPDNRLSRLRDSLGTRYS